MELPVSHKQGVGFAKSPHIRKGYYTAKLIGVKPFADKEGNLIEAKFGHQLIFNFEIYKTDQETGKPIEKMMIKEDELKDAVPVVLSSFVYHENKNDDGTYRTGITPNSKITKTLKALGWEYSENVNKVDPDAFIGKFAEVLVADYEKKDKLTDEIITMSVINDVTPYKGPAIEGVKAAEKKLDPDKEAKKKELKKLLDDGTLSQDGYNLAIEELNK